MSSEVAEDLPTYSVVNKKMKKNHSVPENVESDMSKSSIPMYTVVDKNKSSPKNTADMELDNPTYDMMSADNLYSSTTIETQNTLSNNMKNDEDEKSLSESLCDKRFLCLLVAIIVIIVTSCVCFLITFIQISELRSETAAVQDVSINKLYLQVENTTQYIENKTRRSEASVRMLYNRLLSDNVAQQVSNSSSLQLSEMFENEIRMLILDILENPGQYQDYPAASCSAVLLFAPSSPSGLYWVRSSNGSAVHVYCDMTRLCGNIIGGWMRVVELDMTDNSTQCPSGLRQNNYNNLRTCGINSSGNLACSSATFNLNGIKYSSVHGVIRAYGCGTPNGYSIAQERQNSDLDIDSNYVDGISLTYGMTPRQHIWTFAVDLYSNCETSPSFVHNDDYCGNIDTASSCNSNIQDIQWNGGLCGSQSQCCSLNNPTQFYKQLPQPTTDDIEMRLCRDQSATNENIFIEMIDIYVQ